MKNDDNPINGYCKPQNGESSNNNDSQRNNNSNMNNHKYKNSIKILFYSALDQWTPGLIQLLNSYNCVFENGIYHKDKFLFRIHNWANMTMAGINEIEEADDGSTYINPLYTSENPPNEWLYVFVAPLPLAAKFRPDHELVILGPAFSTDSDVSVFVRPDPNYNKKIIRVGVVQDDITSTIMLKTFLSMIENIFHPNPHSMSLNIDYLKEKYDPKTYKGCRMRLKHMDPNRVIDTELLDACIFTKKECVILDASPELKNVPKRYILYLDSPISHFLGIDHVPRAVYFIHKSQFNNKENEISFFLKFLNESVPRTINTQIVGGMKPLYPWYQTDRDAQLKFMDAAIMTKSIQDIEDLIFAKINGNLKIVNL